MSIYLLTSGAGKGPSGASDPQVTMLKEALLLRLDCTTHSSTGLAETINTALSLIHIRKNVHRELNLRVT